MAGRAGKGRRSWFRIITGVMMALVCAVLLYQFWLFGLVVWYKYQNPGASAVMRESTRGSAKATPTSACSMNGCPTTRSATP